MTDLNRGTAKYAPWYIIAWRLAWVVPVYLLLVLTAMLHSIMYLQNSPLWDEVHL